MTKEEKMQQDISEVKQQLALNNQFNEEVIKPFIKEVKEYIKNSPSRVEFDALKEEIEGKVDRKEVYAIAGTIGFVGTCLGVLISLFTVFQRFGG